MVFLRRLRCALISNVLFSNLMQFVCVITGSLLGRALNRCIKKKKKKKKKTLIKIPQGMLFLQLVFWLTFKLKQWSNSFDTFWLIYFITYLWLTYYRLENQPRYAHFHSICTNGSKVEEKDVHLQQIISAKPYDFLMVPPFLMLKWRQLNWLWWFSKRPLFINLLFSQLPFRLEGFESFTWKISITKKHQEISWSKEIIVC